MRLSIATKVFLGFVAVLVCSAALSAYGVARLHRIGEGLSLLSRPYMPLARAVGERLASAQQLVASAQRTATDRDVLDRIAVGLDDVAASVADEHKAADAVTARLERAARGPDAALEDAI